MQQRAGQKRSRNDSGIVNPIALAGVEVDDELVLGRRLHRQVSRLLALEDTGN